MKQTLKYRFILGLSASTTLAILALAGPASAASSTSSATSAASQARLQRIISRGNTEIDRRLATLNTLSGKIASATKLSSSDAATLNNTVSSDISELTSLKAQLDADTTVASAVTDAQSIINDYRVYALVVPQVDLVKTADDQQVAESKLVTFSGNLSTRITAEQQKGVNVTALQDALDVLNSNVSAAQTISSSIESSVIGLVPSDYNSNHAVLSGDRDQLLTAQANIKAAIADGKSIIAHLPAAS